MYKVHYSFASTVLCWVLVIYTYVQSALLFCYYCSLLGSGYIYLCTKCIILLLALFFAGLWLYILMYKPNQNLKYINNSLYRK